MSRLLCEGIDGGPDAVVLAALFAPDGPEIKPAISKTSLGAGVRALRRVGRMHVAAIRDRDFDFEPERKGRTGAKRGRGAQNPGEAT